MTMTILGPVFIQRPRYKYEAATSGVGMQAIQIGMNSADIKIVVDVEKLARLLGPKAMKNRKHSSQLCGGAIVVEAVNIR